MSESTTNPTDVASATAAARPIKLGGKEYRLSPLDAADWGELHAWAQEEYLKLARIAARDLPPDERALFLAARVHHAAAMGFNQATLLAIRSSPQGIARYLWLGFRRNHPDLTPEIIAQLVVEDAERDRATEVANRANRLEGSGDPKAP